MKRNDTILYVLMLAASLWTGGCAHDGSGSLPVEEGVTVRMSLVPFDGDLATRTATDGLSFESNDRFRMKIICPHTTTHQAGESWSSGYYQFTIDGTGEVYISAGQSTEVQATTYVYTAQNTTGTRVFVVDNIRYSRPSNFFCADQSKLEWFKQSDVVWAQAFRQTGAKEVHLNFRHKVARLDIVLNDSSLTQTVDEVEQAHPLSENAVLTLEGMPDIDGAEIVVGDYYADECYESERYNYREKASCDYANNGKVLGIEVLDEAGKRSSIAGLTGCPEPGGANSVRLGTVANTATYTAYHDPADAKHYLLYVPPCVLATKAVFWVRDGERRYSAPLENLTFEEGKTYPVRLKLENPAAATEE